jgi:hypothetical protein
MAERIYSWLSWLPGPVGRWFDARWESAMIGRVLRGRSDG